MLTGPDFDLSRVEQVPAPTIFPASSTSHRRLDVKNLNIVLLKLIFRVAAFAVLGVALANGLEGMDLMALYACKHAGRGLAERPTFQICFASGTCFSNIFQIQLSLIGISDVVVSHEVNK